MNPSLIKAILLDSLFVRIPIREDCESPQRLRHSKNLLNGSHAFFNRRNPEPDAAQTLRIALQPQILHCDGHINLGERRDFAVYTVG